MWAQTRNIKFSCPDGPERSKWPDLTGPLRSAAISKRGSQLIYRKNAKPSTTRQYFNSPSNKLPRKDAILLSSAVTSERQNNPDYAEEACIKTFGILVSRLDSVDSVCLLRARVLLQLYGYRSSGILNNQHRGTWFLTHQIIASAIRRTANPHGRDQLRYIPGASFHTSLCTVSGATDVDDHYSLLLMKKPSGLPIFALSPAPTFAAQL